MVLFLRLVLSELLFSLPFVLCVFTVRTLCFIQLGGRDTFFICFHSVVFIAFVGLLYGLYRPLGVEVYVQPKKLYCFLVLVIIVVALHLHLHSCVQYLIYDFRTVCRSYLTIELLLTIVMIPKLSRFVLYIDNYLTSCDTTEWFVVRWLSYSSIASQFSCTSPYFVFVKLMQPVILIDFA